MKTGILIMLHDHINMKIEEIVVHTDHVCFR